MQSGISFATNSPVAKKKLSGSTDVVLFVKWGMAQFFKVILPRFCSLKKTHFFFTICDRILSCAEIVLWTSLSYITWILCFDFKLSMLEPLFVYNGARIELWCSLSLVV